YFGFLHHILHIPTITFDSLFDINLITNYVHWHVNERHCRPTVTIKRFLEMATALTNQYRPLPQLRSQLSILQKTVPSPSPVYNKEDAWVSLTTLDEIGRSIWPHKQPKEVNQSKKYPGLRYAVRAGLSLMLRLWTYIPYRQRNMREMKLGENLYKDSQGKWRILFRGEQLKVAY